MSLKALDIIHCSNIGAAVVTMFCPLTDKKGAFYEISFNTKNEKLIFY